VRFLSCLRVALTTSLNVVLNAVTLGGYVWLEGRVHRGVFMNWVRDLRYRPKTFIRPTTEEEIVELVKNSRSVRVFGAGHPFHAGVVSDDTLVSLDDYSGLVWKRPRKDADSRKGRYTHT
jgi:FAD/FMN-containing dehydrogenase